MPINKPYMHPFKKHAIAALIGNLVVSGSASATIYNISNISSCTLPEAITAANTNTATTNCAAGSVVARDIINLLATQNPITPTSLNILPFVTSDITINGGPGVRVSRVGMQDARFVAVTGQGDLIVNQLEVFYGSFPIGPDFQGAGFYVGQDARLELNDVRLFRIHNDSGGFGGAIYSKGELILNDVDIEESRALNGGGISLAGGSATIRNSRIHNNTATSVNINAPTEGRGAGVFAEDSQLRIQQSTITENESNRGAGGIYLNNSSLQLFDSTVHNNTARYFDGGGVTVLGSSGTISNSTFTNNRGRFGGAIHINLSSNVTLTHITASNNQALFGTGGGLWVQSSTARLQNSILANNRDGSNASDDCNVGSSPTISTGSHSIIEADHCSTGALSVDPQLGALADNGGPTLTLLPNSGSSAIEAGQGSFCTTNDQRLLPRPQGSFFPIVTKNNKLAVTYLDANCDSGAVQRQPTDGLP